MDPPESNIPSPSSSHRLPTVSASHALRALKIHDRSAVSTGLKQLDALLQPRTGSPAQGGLIRGQVTEIYGPPGSGKTALGLQASKSALQRGGHVVWIDAATAVPKPRLEILLSTSPSPPSGLSSSIDETLSATDMLPRFHHYSVPALAHLLTLFINPTATFPPPGTALIVVDSVSTLFDRAYPRTGATTSNTNDNKKWASGRRYAVMNSLVSALGKIAAVRDIPVVITNQTTTLIRKGFSTLLVPGMAGLEWDNGIATRLVLFRDWPLDPGRLVDLEDEKRKKTRYVGAVKVAGVGLNESGGLGTVVPFIIESCGLCDVDLRTVEVPIQTLTSPVRSSKRTYTEIADSEDEFGSDELYDWGEEDEIAAEGLIDDAALAGDPPERKSLQPPQKKRATESKEGEVVVDALALSDCGENSQEPPPPCELHDAGIAEQK